ncbi:UDP-glucuronosyltransferase 2B15-like isoform X1 [Ostrinia furnacalis]|uniref:UDP-glucuronosyltransferase 2B15-like isoform X1 n=1 Tax=Ostrinia furnacalis TaxID=93504 RepID=UPI00103ADECB|nr:UDP-glucuronosyltransferase 2B15-like isoform X1 [Ostrinia furnacalis]
MELLRIILCLFCVFSSIEGYKVLVAFPLPVRSLNLLGEGLVRHLLNAGHEVTYITAYPFKDPPKKNFRQIDLSSVKSVFANQNKLNTGYMMNNRHTNDIYYVQELALNCAKATFADQNLQKLLQDTSESFDVVIADLLETEIYAGLSAVYDCPMVWLYSMGAHSVALRLVDQPANPAYASDYLTGHIPPLTFVQRVEQLWAHVQWYFLKWFFIQPEETVLYQRTFEPLLAKRGRPLPDYQELIYNASLMFSNEHNALGNVPAIPQNFRFVGGFHIEDPPKALPQDLQAIMDLSKHGVIYFSMGSTWQSKDIPESVTRGLLNMFGELKETVLWKYEENLPNLPPNVKIVQWAPQHSILAHPNLRMFISHGGLLSSTEALHFGVPTIGIPVMFDQYINVNKAVSSGYALSAELSDDLPNTLRPLIREMLDNPIYRQKAKQSSMIYHDRPVTAGKELVHWTEHVIKTKGAPHLRSPALRIPVYQKLYLDLLLVVVVLLFICKKALSLVFKKKVNQKQKKN